MSEYISLDTATTNFLRKGKFYDDAFVGSAQDLILSGRNKS